MHFRILFLFTISLLTFANAEEVDLSGVELFSVAGYFYNNATDCKTTSYSTTTDRKQTTQRRGQININLKDQNNNPLLIELKVVANLILNGRGAYDDCSQLVLGFDKLDNKPLKSILGTYKGTKVVPNKILSTSVKVKNLVLINENGVRLYAFNQLFDTGMNYDKDANVEITISKIEDGKNTTFQTNKDEDFRSQSINANSKGILEKVFSSRGQGKR